MLSGRQALHSIDDTIRNEREQLQRVEADVKETTQRIVALRKTQAERYKSLARIRLDHLVSGELAAGLDAADQRAAELLRERVSNLEDLQRQIEDGREELAALEKRRGELSQRLEQAAEALDREEAEVQRRLRVDSAYQGQLAKAQLAARTAEFAEEKTERAEQDRREKGRPYEDDPLFSYLWKRHYGTSEYSANPLTRMLDKWVAGLVRYQDARPNYHMLLEIPARLREHAQQVRAAAERESQALENLEEKAAVAGGLPALRNAVSAAEKAIRETDQSIEAQEQRIHELTEQRGRFIAGEDDYFRQSLEAMAGAFQRENLQALYRYARATATAEDDLLVREIADAEEEVENLQDTLREHKRMHDKHLERMKELEELRHRFKRERYDDVHSGFDNGAMLAMILGQFLQGMANSGDIWRTLERGRKYRRIEADPTFGSGGLGRPGGSWRVPFPTAPRRFPPPNIGRRGGFGGGFKTGGGF